jgi:hypothetical protein
VDYAKGGSKNATHEEKLGHHARVAPAPRRSRRLSAGRRPIGREGSPGRRCSRRLKIVMEAVRRITASVTPVSGEVLTGVGNACWILRGMPLGQRAKVVLTDADSCAGSEQPGGRTVKVLTPVALGPEERTVVGELILIDEHVTALGQMRPQVADALVEAGLVVDVDEGEHYRLGMKR